MSAMIIGMGLLGITSWAANDLDDLRLTSSQATNPFSDTPAQIFTARRHSEIEYSHTRRIYRTNEVHVLFAVGGLTSGLLFALSGPGSGALGLVLTLLISVGLYQMHPAHRMMNLFEDLSNVYPFQKPNQFPSYVDGIRVY